MQKIVVVLIIQTSVGKFFTSTKTTKAKSHSVLLAFVVFVKVILSAKFFIHHPAPTFAGGNAASES